MNPSPFVKWAGGKGQLLSQFEPFFPTRFESYIEPFVGGGAVFFHLHNLGRLAGREIILIDHLEELINCYRVVQNQVEALLTELGRHEPHKQDPQYYYDVRAWDRHPAFGQRSDAERAARTLFLNHTCYNGLYRVNRRGEFNVPFGRYGRLAYTHDFTAYRQVFSRWDFSSLDFEALRLKPRDFVYADPPYDVPFTQYARGGFSWDDQVRAAEWLARHPGPVVLSNQATPPVVALYRKLGYDIRFLAAPRRISCTGDRTPVREVLATRNVESVLRPAAAAAP